MSMIWDAHVWIIHLLMRVSAAHHRVVDGQEVEFVDQTALVDLAAARLPTESCCAASQLDRSQAMLPVHSHINIQHVNHVRIE